MFSLCSSEFVLCLDAPDEILQDRVMNMPEGLGEHSTVYELFLQRLSKYRDDNKGDEAEDFFDELDIPSTCRGNKQHMLTNYDMYGQIFLTTNCKRDTY